MYLNIFVLNDNFLTCQLITHQFLLKKVTLISPGNYPSASEYPKIHHHKLSFKFNPKAAPIANLLDSNNLPKVLLAEYEQLLEHYPEAYKALKQIGEDIKVDL